MRPLLRLLRLKHASLLPWDLRAPPQSLVPRRIATTSAHNAAPIDLPRLIVPHGSKSHDSLATFIEHANRAKLCPSRTYYVGTHYEYTAALSLKRLGFSLLRTGAKNDAGIDLIGHWVLAPVNEPLPVLIQCKARKCSIGPSHIRELEGTFRSMPPDWKKKSVIGLIATTLKATKGTMEAIQRSAWPMGFVLISRQGLIQQFVWNKAASDRGLQGVGVTVRHTPRALLVEAKVQGDTEEQPSGKEKRLAKFANSGTQKDIQLTWMGSPIFPERDTLDQETLDLMSLAAPDEASTQPPLNRLGRPRKRAADSSVRLKPGPKPTRHHAPSPRGGQVVKPRHPVVPKLGRPKGAKNKIKVVGDAG